MAERSLPDRGGLEDLIHLEAGVAGGGIWIADMSILRLLVDGSLPTCGLWYYDLVSTSPTY